MVRSFRDPWSHPGALEQNRILKFGWEHQMEIDEKLLEIREFSGIGYQPLIYLTAGGLPS